MDGYGFVINPVGSQTQPWHIDYSLDYSTIFIPMSPLTPNNAMQYLVLPPSLPEATYAQATVDPDHINLDELLASDNCVSVRQMLARPFAKLKLDFTTIHRGISNTGDSDRVVFWVSVKKHGPLLPVEGLVEVLRTS